MQFRFKSQEYQTEAVNAVCDVFLGQGKQSIAEYSRDLGKRVKTTQSDLTDSEEDVLGYRNAEVMLSEEQLLQSIQRVQRQNNLKLSSTLDRSLGAVSLDVEMETGTGKTYVYIKTIFDSTAKSPFPKKSS